MALEKKTKKELISEIEMLQTKLLEHESNTKTDSEDQKKLRESEEKFKLAFITSTDSININRLSDGLYIEINDGFTRITGYTADDVIGKTSLEINIWENHEDRNRLVKGLRENGQVENLEAKFKMKDGRIIYGLMSASIILLNNEPHILSITRDITKRKLAEEALARSAKRYRKAEAVGRFGNWEYDLNTSTFWGSDETKRIYGFEADSLNFTTDEVENCIPERERVHQALVDLIENDIEYNFEFDIITKDKGERKTIHSIAEVERDAGGNPIRVTGVITDLTLVKKKTKELEESEERFRELVETINSGVAIYKVINNGESGKDYIIQDFNRAALELENMKKEDVIGKRLFDIRPKIDDFGLIPIFKKVWETGEPEFYPATIYIDEKYSNYYENRVFRLPSGEVVAIYDDVTENEINLRKVKESEERFNLAMKASNDGIFDWNLVTNEIYYSPGWKRMLGYEDNELPNDFSIWEKLTELEDVKKSWEMQQEVISKKRDRFIMEFKMKHKDGHWVDILSRAEAVFDETGKAVRMIGTHIDISERKKAEVRIRESERLLQTLIETIPDLVWMKDAKGVYLTCNPKFERFFGASLSQIKGKTDHDFIDKELADFFRQKDNEAIAKGSASINEEEVTYADDGHSEIIETIKTPMYDQNGKVIGVLGIARDISERKKAEKELSKHREHLEELVKERTVELEEKNEELEKFNKLFAGREFRIKELKLKIEELEKKI